MGIAVPSGARQLVGPRVLGVIVGAGLMLAAVLVIGGRHDNVSTDARALPPGVNAAQLLDKTGARVVRVTTAGGLGGLIDVRYQIVDANKAAALHDVKRPPALVDESTGRVIYRLLMGHSHVGVFHAGETYFFEFEDPAGLVKPGSKVSVVMGPVMLQHVRVQ